MRLSCPKCSTEYDVPDAALVGRSRKLRCDRCDHSWRTEPLPVPGQEAAAAPTAPQPQVAAAPAPLPPAFPPEARPAEQERWPAYAEDVGAWSEEEISSDRTLRISPAAARRFGQPVDQAALAEVLAAVGQEQKYSGSVPPPLPPAFAMPEEPPAPPPPPVIGDSLPAFLTAERGADTVMVSEPETDDRFAELVYAARNKSIEFEPEPPPPPPPVRTSNKPMFITLVVLFVVAVVMLEHDYVVRFIPATRRFFMALGLK